MKNIFLAATPDQTLTALIIATVIALAIIVIAFIIRKKSKKAKYSVKPSLMTPTEKEYFRAIEAAVGDRYIVLPQVNLASVIDKTGEGFRSELFRNVDFGVFDYDYSPVLLIEINDNTHFRKDRMERDEKVGAILKKARLPLVTFWTKDGFSQAEITRTLSKYL